VESQTFQLLGQLKFSSDQFLSLVDHSKQQVSIDTDELVKRFVLLGDVLSSTRVNGFGRISVESTPVSVAYQRLE
jgi:hypothetical protein